MTINKPILTNLLKWNEANIEFIKPGIHVQNKTKTNDLEQIKYSIYLFIFKLHFSKGTRVNKNKQSTIYSPFKCKFNLGNMRTIEYHGITDNSLNSITIGKNWMKIKAGKTRFMSYNLPSSIQMMALIYRKVMTSNT